MIVSWMKPNCVNTKLSVYVIINVNPVDIIISLWLADWAERFVVDKGRSSNFQFPISGSAGKICGQRMF